MRPGILNPRQILNHLPAQDDWYSIANKSSAERVDVYLYDEIGVFGTTADDLIRELKEIKTSQIVVHINSVGGDIFDGVTVYNALRTHPSPVTTTVDSLAASIASVIVQAGDIRLMLTGSQMMIHEAWGLGMGGAEAMREYADLLDKQTDNIAGIYAERSGGDQDDLLTLMKNETWLSPAEAVAEGLADAVVSPEPEATRRENRVDMTGFMASCEVGSGTVGRSSKSVWAEFISSTEIEV